MKKAVPMKVQQENTAARPAIAPPVPKSAGRAARRSQGEAPIPEELKCALALISHYCRELQEKFGDALSEPCRQYVRKIRQLAEIGGGAEDETLQAPEPANSGRRPSFGDFPKAAVKTVDLGEISKNIVEGLMLTMPQRRIKFISAISVTANGNGSLLRIALRNLLHHAWKRTSELEETIIELGVTEVEGKTAYFIRNNGAALGAAEAAEMLGGIDGDGIIDLNGHGVDTAARIIKSHGGRIWIDGPAGGGSVFFFTI